MRMVARAACAPVRLYQAVTAGRRPSCRYWPTCSQYAIDAIEGHGLTRGSWLAARRLSRCHPWSPGGVDYVPDLPRRGQAEHRSPGGAPA